MNTEEKSDFFIQQLHHILLNDWDPIGISKNKDMNDEYDAYIEDLLDFLAEENASKAQIIEFFLYIEVETMGLKPNNHRATLVTDKVWQAFEDFLNE